MHQPPRVDRSGPDTTRIRDLLLLLKPGIVGSNALTALAGFAVALAGSPGLSPVDRSGLVGPIGIWLGVPAVARPGAAGLILLGAVLILGVSALVAGSCAFNNWIDRDIDALMERTKNRPTAKGRIGRGLALGLGGALSALGLAILLTLGLQPAIIGFAGALIYVFVYSLWAKRRTALSSFIGGVSGAVPPLIGWSVADPGLRPPAWILFGLLLLWQQVHVRALALRRSADYESAGIPMAGIDARAATGASKRGRPPRQLMLWLLAVLAYSPLLLWFGPWSLGFSLAFCSLWLATGLFGWNVLSRRSWADMMFFASLLYLIALSAFLLLSALGRA